MGRLSFIALVISLLLGIGVAVAAPVILNEYNAVDDTKWLDKNGLTASTKSDTYFGRVAGNGGDWFELVVVGNGTAGSTVDMQRLEDRD